MKDAVVKGQSTPNIKPDSALSEIFTLLLWKPSLSNIKFGLYDELIFIFRTCNSVEAHLEMQKRVSQHI